MRTAYLPAILLTMLSCAAGAQEAGGLRVTVDPRVELLSAAISQSEWAHSQTMWFSPYAQSLQQTVFAQRQHAAIKRLNALRRPGVTLTNLLAWSLLLGPAPGFARPASEPGALAQRVGGVAVLDQLADELAAFARETGFAAFLEQHRAFYDELVGSYRGKLPAGDPVERLRAYSGARDAVFAVILAPLFGPFRFAAVVRPAAGPPQYVAMDQPDGYREGKLQFGETRAQEMTFLGLGRSVVAHALSSVPATERDRHAEWLGLLRQKMEWQGVGAWSEMLNENAAYALAMRLYEQSGQPQRARELAGAADANGFLLAPFLAERLKEYEAARDRYPTLTAFAPRLVAALDTIVPDMELGEPSDLGLDDVGLQGNGVPVFKVGQNTPAARAGIRPGDTVTSMAGISITGSESYLKAWHRWEASLDGQRVPFGIARKGKKLVVYVVMRRSQEFHGFRRKGEGDK